MQSERRLSRAFSDGGGMVDEALELVMAHLDDPRDRSAVSLVCKKWYQVDARTRKHVTVAFCYSIKPSDLSFRFPRLESLKLKAKPRAAMFNLIPADWGGYAGPWIREITINFLCLKSLHLRRMVVTDDDLRILICGRGHMLQVLKLDMCSGFSTEGLYEVARICRLLRVLFLEESTIEDKGGDWLHELAINNNSSLETLNFYMTGLETVNVTDIILIAAKCPCLTSLKINDCDFHYLTDVFKNAKSLEEFGGGSFVEVNGADPSSYHMIKLPSKVTSLSGLYDMSELEMPFLFPQASFLKKLDLKFTRLSAEDHCALLQLCTNLEILEVLNVIGDSGLRVVAEHCKRLKRLRVERGEDDLGSASHEGLATVAEGCPDLEFIAVYVSDITNSALEAVGRFCKKLRDFRLVLLDKEEEVADLPLDNGVRDLLLGCQKLTRFACYLRPGGLSDTGLGYIGRYSTHVRWMLLGYVGESDSGLRQFSLGCPKLERLELRGCCFSESAISVAVLNLRALKYIWVQGYDATPTGKDLLFMARPFWNIEFTPEGIERPAEVLAYYSLAGRRTDHPETVIPFPAPLIKQQQ
eukprot:TRINITY_DN23402_c0_g1_i1.p1 TRINITY_DN23402_c0_g1~~TRINITY_DN23402_c0_g1_i1.p1  ORF type:complete len:583 (-),score=85.49 TRINITY_DN23402_c0_g1_i1:394-2142(-)